MTKIRQFFASLFGISSSEFSGFTWLIVTAVVCITVLFVVNKATLHPYTNYEADARILDSLLVVMENSGKGEGIKNTINYFEFDPNTASNEQLIQLGFPEWLAERLIKYRNKGGKFGKADDLLSLYGFPETLYAQVAPYVRIEEVKLEKEALHEMPAQAELETKNEKTSKPLPRFDLNHADTAMLQTVKGIGSVLSNRIVSYRNKLGGFVHIRQLTEVYNLDSATIEELLQTAFISPDFKPSQIAINSVDEKQLAAHPYLSWKQAKLIIAYRNQHGNFDNAEALLNVYSINSEWLEKIAPYLSF